MKHSPGPWKVAPSGHHVLSSALPDGTVNSDSRYVCTLPNPKDPKTFHPEEVAVNAALIAAAPQMLKALEAMDRARRTPMVDDDFPEMLHIADSEMAAALKAARGEK